MNEEYIVYEIGDYWVYRDRNQYTCLKNLGVASETIAAFELDDDGLSLAKAYCDYRAKSH
jgi:hypothetical protein